MPAVTKHFTSGREYLNWLNSDDTRAARSVAYSRSGGEVTGNVKTAKLMLEHGHDDTDAINALIDQFSFELPSSQRITRASVRGHRVNMSAYLVGSPLNMIKRDTDLTDHSPLRIWIGITSSWGISPAQINKRGAALAAFALALSARRTVYITPYVVLGSGDNSAVISCDLQSSPLYLNELAAHMNVNLTRFLGIFACRTLNNRCDGGWPRGYDNETTMRARLGCAEADVYLGSIHLQDPLLIDPVAWIKANLSKYLGDDEE